MEQVPVCWVYRWRMSCVGMTSAALLDAFIWNRACDTAGQSDATACRRAMQRITPAVLSRMIGLPPHFDRITPLAAATPGRQSYPGLVATRPTSLS